MSITRASFPPTSESTDAEAPAVSQSTDGLTAASPRDREERGSASPALGPKLPRIVRPRTLGRAAHPGDVPQPDHHHLPGWVRRVHGQARPIIADLLGNLEGEPRRRFGAQVEELIGGISSGKFSLAWQYPGLISSGQSLYEEHRREGEEQARQRRTLETARRRVSDQLRDQAGRVPADAATRLQRALRSATEVTEIRALETELDQTLTSARSVEERRRDREIDKTRDRIRRSLPRGGEPETPAESWQDVLRRLADQYSE